MKKKVLIFDTSVMCVWLRVPGKETCGQGETALTYNVINDKIENEKKEGTIFVLPIASIIETGNHIAHTDGDKFKLGEDFASLMSEAADSKSPWAAFTEQSVLWSPDKLKALAERWKESVICGQSLGDASIVEVADYYAQMGCQVEIYTGDKGLKAYEPVNSIPIPRRRRKE